MQKRMETRYEEYTAWFGFVGCDLNFDIGMEWDGKSKTAWISTHCWWLEFNFDTEMKSLNVTHVIMQPDATLLPVGELRAVLDQVVWLPTLDKHQIVSNVPWGPGASQISWVLEHNTHPTIKVWVQINKQLHLIFNREHTRGKRTMFPGVIHSQLSHKTSTAHHDKAFLVNFTLRKYFKTVFPIF